jgi:predicted DCC family thiol-disulfide oxidoreductase YuxK
MVEADDRPQETVLLYDGVCALCNRVVRLVLRHDRRGQLMFAPLGGEYAAGLLERRPELRHIDSIIWVTRDGAGAEHVKVRSEAAFAVAEYLGGGWRAARVLRFLPRVLLDAAYNAVARVRYRVFGRHESCPVPPAEVRSRFKP